MSSSKQQLNLLVKSNEFEDINFSIRSSTVLSKLFQRYCERNNIKSETVSFLFNGTKINSEDTPKRLGMKDQDEIQCVLNQVGG
jgi:small ubiquitin-related modifier